MGLMKQFLSQQVKKIARGLAGCSKALTVSSSCLRSSSLTCFNKSWASKSLNTNFCLMHFRQVSNKFQSGVYFGLHSICGNLYSRRFQYSLPGCAIKKMIMYHSWLGRTEKTPYLGYQYFIPLFAL